MQLVVLGVHQMVACPFFPCLLQALAGTGFSPLTNLVNSPYLDSFASGSSPSAQLRAMFGQLTQHHRSAPGVLGITPGAGAPSFGDGITPAGLLLTSPCLWPDTARSGLRELLTFQVNMVSMLSPCTVGCMGTITCCAVQAILDTLACVNW